MARLAELALDAVEHAQPEVSDGQAVGVIHRFADVQRLLAVGDPLAERPALREQPREPGATLHRREAAGAEALATEIALQQQHHVEKAFLGLREITGRET